MISAKLKKHFSDGYRRWFCANGAPYEYMGAALTGGWLIAGPVYLLTRWLTGNHELAYGVALVCGMLACFIVVMVLAIIKHKRSQGQAG